MEAWVYEGVKGCETCELHKERIIAFEKGADWNGRYGTALGRTHYEHMHARERGLLNEHMESAHLRRRIPTSNITKVLETVGQLRSERDEARAWARRMKLERDAQADSLSAANTHLERVTRNLYRQEFDNNALRAAVSDLRKVMLENGIGKDRLDEMVGEPLVVLEEAARFFSTVIEEEE
jgi:hypothetical protein